MQWYAQFILEITCAIKYLLMYLIATSQRLQTGMMLLGKSMRINDIDDELHLFVEWY